MTGRTQERLRDATTALAQAVQSEDIPGLRLPDARPSARARSPRGWPARARSPRGRPARGRPGFRSGARSWLIPAAAAASVLAVTGLAVLVGRAGPGGPPGPPSAAAAGLPRYLVTYGNGVYFVPGGGPGYVRDTATGRVVARIGSAGPDFTVEGLAAAPGDRTFYLIGEDTSGGASGKVKIECFRVELSADGRPGEPRLVPGSPLLTSLPPTSNGATSIPLAVSPDGRELAYPLARQPAAGDEGAAAQSIIVQNVATGARRSWTAWPGADPQIGQVSWAAGGRLGFVAALDDAAVDHGTVVASRHRYLNVFMILHTTGGGSGLISASQLVSYGSATVSAAGTIPSTPPGPVAGVISPDGRSAYAQILTPHGGARVVALSVGTGQVSRVLVSGPRAVRSAPVGIDGRDLLISLGLRHPAGSGGRPYASGQLAGLGLPGGRLVPLPLPTYTGVEAPVPPLEAAW